MGQTFVFICLLDGSMLTAVLAFRLKVVVKVNSGIKCKSLGNATNLLLSSWVGGAHCPSLHHTLTGVDSPDLARFFSKKLSFFIQCSMYH